MGGCREESQTLLKSALLEGQETKGKMEHRNFQLNVRKKDFHHKGAQTLEQGSREAEMSPPLEILKSQWADPEHPDLTGRRAGLADPWRPLPTSVFCQDFTKVCVLSFTTGVFSWNFYLIHNK